MAPVTSEPCGAADISLWTPRPLQWQADKPPRRFTHRHRQEKRAACFHAALVFRSGERSVEFLTERQPYRAGLTGDDQILIASADWALRCVFQLGVIIERVVDVQLCLPIVAIDARREVELGIGSVLPQKRAGLCIVCRITRDVGTNIIPARALVNHRSLKMSHEIVDRPFVSRGRVQLPKWSYGQLRILRRYRIGTVCNRLSCC